MGCISLDILEREYAPMKIVYGGKYGKAERVDFYRQGTGNVSGNLRVVYRVRQSSGGSSLLDQANWTLGMGAMGLQASSSTYRLYSQGYGFSPWVYSKNYPASPYFNRYSLSKVGTGLSRGLAGAGVVVDFVRYRRGEISGKKFGFNAGMAAFGTTGVGTIPAAFYFGMEAFYPGGMEGAMRDNAQYQREVDGIMNTGNRGTHFYILPWGAQKL